MTEVEICWKHFEEAILIARGSRRVSHVSQESVVLFEEGVVSSRCAIISLK